MTEHRRPQTRAGVTMTELMVVLVLLGLMAAVVGLAWRREPAPTGQAGQDSIAVARHQAVTSGRVVRFQMTVDGRTVTIAALPDGRVVAPQELHVDPLTGLPLHE